MGKQFFQGGLAEDIARNLHAAAKEYATILKSSCGADEANEELTPSLSKALKDAIEFIPLSGRDI